MRNRARACCMVLTALALGGCAAAALINNPLRHFENQANLAEENYAAADYLIGQAKNYVTHDRSIKAMPLLDEQEPRLMTELGKQIPEQVGGRLVQLGYRVDLTSVVTGIDPQYAAAPQPVVSAPDFILSGSYIRKASIVDVKLRLQDARTGEERGTFAYSLPRTGEIRRDTKTKPLIYPVPNR